MHETCFGPLEVVMGGPTYSARSHCHLGGPEEVS